MPIKKATEKQVEQKEKTTKKSAEKGEPTKNTKPVKEEKPKTEKSAGKKDEKKIEDVTIVIQGKWNDLEKAFPYLTLVDLDIDKEKYSAKIVISKFSEDETERVEENIIIIYGEGVEVYNSIPATKDMIEKAKTIKELKVIGA